MYENMDRLFTLRVALGGASSAVLNVTAYDANHVDSTGHSRIDVQATLTENDARCSLRKRVSRVIFKRGDTWCAVASGTSVDGNEARELVLSLLAMKPGDTDADYFAGYTPEQLEFAKRYGDDISCERERRYCDENGGVRR